MSSDSKPTPPTPGNYGQEMVDKCLDAPTFNEATWSASDASDRIKYFQPPNPEWKYGDRVETTERGKKWMEGITSDSWVHLDPTKEGPVKTYRTLMTGVQPRPISFISSISADGVENLSCYSSINALSPPGLVSFLCSFDQRPGSDLKDTAHNIQETKGFTVNMVNLPWLENAVAAAIDAPRDHILSEWDISGLTREPSTYVKAARVKEAAFSLECEFIDKHDIIFPATGTVGITAIFGQVKCIHIRKDVLNAQGNPDPAKMMNVSKMGDITYGTVTEAFRLPAHFWEVDGQAVEKILDDKIREKKENGTVKVNGTAKAKVNKVNGMSLKEMVARSSGAVKENETLEEKEMVKENGVAKENGTVKENGTAKERPRSYIVPKFRKIWSAVGIQLQGSKA